MSMYINECMHMGVVSNINAWGGGITLCINYCNINHSGGDGVTHSWHFKGKSFQIK